VVLEKEIGLPEKEARSVLGVAVVVSVVNFATFSIRRMFKARLARQNRSAPSKRKIS
jgi:hypothetical protein